MSYLRDFDISASGLSAQRLRMNIISANIANANTTRTSEGGAYRRQDVVFKAEEFGGILEKNSKNGLEYENILSKNQPILSKVAVDKIVRNDGDFRLKYEPNHPDANEQGYVAYPNINPVIEMANLIEATRAYQANVSAFNSAKAITQSAIDLLKG